MFLPNNRFVKRHLLLRVSTRQRLSQQMCGASSSGSRQILSLRSSSSKRRPRCIVQLPPAANSVVSKDSCCVRSGESVSMIHVLDVGCNKPKQTSPDERDKRHVKPSYKVEWCGVWSATSFGRSVVRFVSQVLQRVEERQRVSIEVVDSV